MHIQNDDIFPSVCQNVSTECTIDINVSIFLLVICFGKGGMLFRNISFMFSSRIHINLEKLKLHLLTIWVLLPVQFDFFFLSTYFFSMTGLTFIHPFSTAYPFVLNVVPIVERQQVFRESNVRHYYAQSVL